ncbi:MAG: metallophosphoesterase [Bdellovibrionota bacterium]
MKAFLLATFFLIITTCAPFKDSPFSDKVLSAERDLNILAQKELQDVEGDGEIKIALFADSHGNHRDLDVVLYQINQTPDVDFVVNLGDFTDSAYNLEYDRFVDSQEVLLRPNFTVMGNHDALGAGPIIFKKIFGPSNFWFETASARFIFFHTSNLEDPEGFEPQWLLDAVASSVKNVFIFSHTSLDDIERFPQELFRPVLQNPLVKMSINGHKHVYDLQNSGGTIVLRAPRVQRLQWLVIRIVGSNLEITRMPGGELISATLKPQPL